MARRYSKLKARDVWLDRMQKREVARTEAAAGRAGPARARP